MYGAPLNPAQDEIMSDLVYLENRYKDQVRTGHRATGFKFCRTLDKELTGMRTQIGV